MNATIAPTPWRIGTIPTAITATAADGEKVLVVAMLGNPGEERSYAERSATAAFIVKACNAHEQLVAALQEIAKNDPYQQSSAGGIARRALVATGFHPG